MECQACFCFMSSHHTLRCVYTQVHFKSQKSFSITSTQDKDDFEIISFEFEVSLVKLPIDVKQCTFPV